MYIFLTGALICLFSFGTIEFSYPAANNTAEIIREATSYEIIESGNYEDSVLDIITVNKEFTYSGQLMPKELINWTETINGKVYSGLLRLSDYYYIASQNITRALYSGELIEQ